MLPCASLEFGKEGVGDLISGTLQVVAEDQAEDLSTFGGGVHLADHARGEAVPRDHVGSLQEFGGGVGDRVSHRFRLN